MPNPLGGDTRMEFHMDSLYAELNWLQRAPDDFAQRFKSLDPSSHLLGRELQALASYALDLNQSTKLAKAISKACSSGESLYPLVPFRLAILSNSTIDLLVPTLIG